MFKPSEMRHHNAPTIYIIIVVYKKGSGIECFTVFVLFPPIKGGGKSEDVIALKSQLSIVHRAMPLVYFFVSEYPYLL